MGLRDKLKSALKPIVRKLPGLGEAIVPAVDDGQGPGQSAVPDPPPPKKTDTGWKAAEPEAPLAPAEPGPATPPPADPPAVESEADKIAQQKARQDKILAKARKGVLAKLDELGGTAQMKELHDYSERRYFIAHRSFSKLMEYFVEQGLIDFDHDAGTCVLTDAGRASTG